MNDLLRIRRHPLARYGIALALASLAVLVRMLLPLPPGVAMYGLAVGAVVVSAWYGGRGPGLVSLLATATGILYWFIPPSDAFLPIPAEHIISLIVFGALGVLVTEFGMARRRAEQALGESEGRFRLMAGSIPEMLWIESLDPRKVLYVSPAYERIWGRPASEVYRDANAWLQAVHPEDRSYVTSALQRWLDAPGDTRYDLEYRILWPDGETRWVHSRRTVIRDEQGRPHRASGIVEDVTDARRSQEALTTARAELAHVARVTTMGQLAASIAHEVNQPLTAIGLSGNACLRWLGAQPPNLDQASETVSRIVKDAERAGEIIARIRAMARKSPAHKDWMDINDAIAEVITLTRPEAQKCQVALQARLSADVPPVHADRVQLQQVLLNLIVNGIEAIRQAADGPRELVIGSDKEVPDGVLVSVRDCGAGLGAGSDRLFEPFYTTKPGGMGMGLAISRSIIESHGGRIWATPNTPRGAVFQFLLPVGKSAS